MQFKSVLLQGPSTTLVPLQQWRIFPGCWNLPTGDPHLSARTVLGWRGLPCLGLSLFQDSCHLMTGDECVKVWLLRSNLGSLGGAPRGLGRTVLRQHHIVASLCPSSSLLPPTGVNPKRTAWQTSCTGISTAEPLFLQEHKLQQSAQQEVTLSEVQHLN